MAIEDLHHLAEQLHNIDQAKRLNAVEEPSITITRRLAIALVQHVDYLEQRIAALDGKTSN